jgi:putative holliday junction resolvase
VRTGVRLAVDVGTVRVGVARSDPSGLLAVPVETVRRGDGDLDRLVALAEEYEVLEVVVGLPISLSGKEGPSAQAARDFANLLAGRVAPVTVRLVDERLSSVSAQQAFHASGVDTRGARGRLDQAAAVVILQSALDVERSTGNPAGEVVPGGTGTEDKGTNVTGPNR